MPPVPSLKGKLELSLDVGGPLQVIFVASWPADGSAPTIDRTGPLTFSVPVAGFAKIVAQAEAFLKAVQQYDILIRQ